jgi:hypothetical protein
LSEEILSRGEIFASAAQLFRVARSVGPKISLSEAFWRNQVRALMLKHISHLPAAKWINGHAEKNAAYWL